MGTGIIQQHELAEYATEEFIEAVSSLQNTERPKAALDKLVRAALLYAEVMLDAHYAYPSRLMEYVVEDPDELKKLFDALDVVTLEGAIAAAKDLQED